MSFSEKPKVRKIENKEGKVLWLGSIGFDFGYRKFNDENGQEKEEWFCFEVNGSNSGIGMERVPKDKVNYLEKLFARIRGRYDKAKYKERLELAKKIDDALKINGNPITKDEMERMEIGYSSHDLYRKVHEYINRALWRAIYPPTAHDNPKFIRHILDNKVLHRTIIPDKYKPEHLNDEYGGYFPYAKTTSGKWIAKPKDSAKGIGIEIFDDEPDRKKLIIKITEHYKKTMGPDTTLADVVVDELKETSGAQEAVGSDAEGRPASIRLLLDFRVLENGEVIIENGNAFQRVSQIKDDDNARYIVNSSTGALSFHASTHEKQKSVEIAKEIIKNITVAYLMHKEQQQKFNDVMKELLEINSPGKKK
jgi:phenylpyruvate tautomerase PptA (4-oxalocrotonate tautomerase family)